MHRSTDFRAKLIAEMFRVASEYIATLPPSDQPAPADASEFSEPTPVPPARSASPPELTECERDILDVLRAAGRRLTRDEICDALDRVNKVQSVATVKRALSHLVSAGTINSRKNKPFGYALSQE